MLRAGRILLSVWTGVNLALAIAIVVAIVLAGRHPPALSLLLTDAQVRALDPAALATFDALGVLANAVIAAFCALALVLIWTGAAARALAAALVFVQAMGFVSDRYLGDRDLAANLASTALLAAGLALVALAHGAVRRRARRSPPRSP